MGDFSSRSFLAGIIFTPVIWNCQLAWDEIAEVMEEQSVQLWQSFLSIKSVLQLVM